VSLAVMRRQNFFEDASTLASLDELAVSEVVDSSRAAP
jgi:hypothetical protein